MKLKKFLKIFISSLLLGATTLLPASAQTTSDFVTRNGASLMLNGSPFRYGGTNNYYLSYKSQYMVNEVLDSTKNMGLTVVRTWAFIDRGSLNGVVPNIDNPLNTGGVYYQYWDPVSRKPVYNDGPNGLERFDYVLYAARQRGLKVIVSLVNNWESMGGIDQYLTWYNLKYHDEFYTNASVRQAYKNWVLHVLNRTNKYTGIRYKDDPTIMAWELANESQCKGSGHKPTSPNCNPTTLLNWVKEMSAFIKRNDTKHLVAVGDEGFFNQPGSPDWAYNGSTGQDFQAFIGVSTIDIGTVHTYPDLYNKSLSWTDQWIQDHSTAAAKAGKPVIFEEFGLQDQASRDTVYNSWLQKICTNKGGSGYNFWMLVHNQDDGTPYPDYDGFTIYYPSQSASNISTYAKCN